MEADTISEMTQLNRTEKSQPFYVPQVSHFRIAVGAIARIRRFVSNYRLRKSINSEEPVAGDLTINEMKDAERILFRIVQRESFYGIDDVRLRNMNIFVAEDGLMRMKSKVVERDDDFSFRYPIVLPGENLLVQMMILETHVRLGHVHVSTLLNDLREEYWIIHARKVARHIIRKCVVCARQNVRHMTVTTVPLPMNRVRDARVFEITGVVYAGPLYLKSEEKAWVCIFTCAVYRAVHLELVSSLSTDRFIEAFRRFVARRGRPNTVYSAN